MTKRDEHGASFLRPTAGSKEAGVDEAGRGCLAGPVVAAAVILPQDIDLHPLLDDSKRLKHLDREVLYDWVTSHASVWCVAQASHDEIDDINILQATYLAMHRAIDGLSTSPDRLLIDGNRFKPYEGIAHSCIVGGDAKVASIAAASILAKVHRDRLMMELDLQYPIYGWLDNKGYPTKQHKEAIRLHGPSPWHRMTFAGVKGHSEST